MKVDFEILLELCADHELGFRALDAVNIGLTRGPVTGNAAYIVQQANGYLQSREMLADALVSDSIRGDTPRGVKAHSRSELSRIAALVVRECGANDWGFLEVLAEGVAYEQDVLKDIREGRRKPDTHKGKDLAKREVA